MRSKYPFLDHGAPPSHVRWVGLPDPVWPSTAHASAASNGDRLTVRINPVASVAWTEPSSPALIGRSSLVWDLRRERLPTCSMKAVRRLSAASRDRAWRRTRIWTSRSVSGALSG